MPNIKTIKLLLIIASSILIVFLIVYFISISMRGQETNTEASKINTSYSNINDDGEEVESKIFASTKETEMNITSKVVTDLIEKDWITKDVSFGTRESTFDDYDIYFDEGIEVKTIIGKVFNIVFTEKCKDNILSGINTSTSLENITKILGKPTFGDIELELIGYKGKDVYVFFSNNEISIYRTETEDGSTGLIELLGKYEENGSVWELGNSLTDLWPEYDSYVYRDDYVNLLYSLKGLRLEYNYTNQNGITIYNNYTGKIVGELGIKELVENQEEIPDYIFIEPERDLVYETEELRVSYVKPRYREQVCEGEDGIDETIETNKFRLYYEKSGEDYKNIQIVSITKEYPNSELTKEMVINSYLWNGESNLIYGITGKGLYSYNCIARQTITLLTGTEDYKLKSLKNGILEYDNTKARLE